MDVSADRSPKRRRVSGLVQTIAVVAVILLGIVALNWPITFAQEPTSPAAGSSTQTLVAPEDDSSSTTDPSVADVANKANPAVVTITNYRNPIDPRTGEEEAGDPVAYGVGSGYIIDGVGHVVTNNHVTEYGVAFEVQLYDGTTLDATFVGSDPFQDVAVLKLNLDDSQTVPATLSFGDSDTARSGDQVIAIGSPYGEFLNSVSNGSISAVDRSLDTDLGYPLLNLIQHSAPIYEGNSGGPLLNMAGEVIGMNVAKVTQSSRDLSTDDQEGIGFAIASDAVKPIVDQILNEGTIDRSYLGVTNDQSSGQVEIVDVVSDGPADQAGMKAGDIITKIGDQTINQRNSFLNILIFDHKPGDTVEITVLRDGQELTLTATLGERPANPV